MPPKQSMPDLALLEPNGEIGGAIRWLSKVLREAGVETAALDARLLVSHVCELTPEQTIATPRFALSPEMTARMNEAAARRIAGEPVSRIMGQREFWGLPFSLSPHTLDPRPETELLVEAVTGYASKEGLSGAPLRILDLGTGSGCLLGSILFELPASSGVGVDLSEKALWTARENLRRLGLLPRAAFLCADWIGALGDASFDIVVGNPPYIGSSDIAGLEIEVRGHDPRLALDGGSDGLEAFRAIFAQAFRVLREKGFLIVETGYLQARAVCDMMMAAAPLGGSFAARVLTDLTGTERAVAGVRQSVHYKSPSKKKVGNPTLSG